jgi:hypothetical protein
VIVSGANPTIASYNASAVNFYNATGSLARLENKNILFFFEKRCSLLCTYNAGVVAVNEKIVGSAPGSCHWSYVKCSVELVDLNLAASRHNFLLKFQPDCIFKDLTSVCTYMCT